MTLHLLRIGKNGVQIVGALMLNLFLINATHAQAQSSAPLKSPKEVLEAYRKIDREGGRLTASGWYSASKFFVKPGRAPEHYILDVIAGERVGDAPNPWVKLGDKKVRIDTYFDDLGQIDALGRFTSVVDPRLIDPSGRPITQPRPARMHGPVPIAMIGYLVLTDTYWEFGPHGEGPREVKGSPEWRLEMFQFEPMVTIDTAIRYLTELRDESSSEVIKTNAEKSIATLRSLKK